MYILIVTGLSGAGKSTALSVLEDFGYVCADNIPCQLVKQYLDLCQNGGINRVALVIDSRESLFGYDPLKTFNELDSLDYSYDLLFLECEDYVLTNRYIETRRRHPMDDDISKGIEKEHHILATLKERAKYVIDTTNMRPRELSKTIESILKNGGNALPFRLVISSFGFKRGIPQNADFVFDVRYTPNPFYVDELRELSGKDEAVRNYVFSNPEPQIHIRQIADMLDTLIPSFTAAGKRRIMVAFGCTGGRHRSVAMAEELHRHMSSKYPVIVEHRDLISEADDIKERFGLVSK